MDKVKTRSREVRLLESENLLQLVIVWLSTANICDENCSLKSRPLVRKIETVMKGSWWMMIMILLYPTTHQVCCGIMQSWFILIQSYSGCSNMKMPVYDRFNDWLKLATIAFIGSKFCGKYILIRTDVSDSMTDVFTSSLSTVASPTLEEFWLWV